MTRREGVLEFVLTETVPKGWAVQLVAAGQARSVGDAVTQLLGKNADSFVLPTSY
jgi:hypothetical protein